MWFDLTAGCFSLQERRLGPWVNLKGEGRDSSLGGGGERPSSVLNGGLGVGNGPGRFYEKFTTSHS